MPTDGDTAPWLVGKVTDSTTVEPSELVVVTSETALVSTTLAPELMAVLGSNVEEPTELNVETIVGIVSTVVDPREFVVVIISLLVTGPIG